MDTQQPRRPIPNIRFRVLIIGRANAGKTSILQRVCDTTDSPIIYRGKEEVRSPLRGPTVLSAGLISLPTRLNLTRPWMFVIMVLFSVASNHGAWQRGEHRIDDELVFSNHTGYVFHDSRGIEAGSTEELRILQEFIRRKCGERRLRSKLHAIWFGLSNVSRVQDKTTNGYTLRYCVPMDNQRPQLDLKFYKDICPDKNGTSLRAFLTVSNALLQSSRHCGVH